MLGDLFASDALPFTLALGGILVILALELIGLLVGASVSSLVDEALPDMDPGIDADFDAGPDVGPDVAGAGSFAERALSWLSFGRVPALVLLILFLLGFGVSGLLLQALDAAWLGDLFPAALVAVPAAAAGLLSMRLFGGALGRIVPKEETAAISREGFVGMTGTVAQGIARAGLPAQVRLTDRHGTTHYLLAEPDDPTETYATGTAVVVTEVHGARAKVIAYPDV